MIDIITTYDDIYGYLLEMIQKQRLDWWMLIDRKIGDFTIGDYSGIQDDRRTIEFDFFNVPETISLFDFFEAVTRKVENENLGNENVDGSELILADRSYTLVVNYEGALETLSTQCSPVLLRRGVINIDDNDPQLDEAA